MHTPNTSPKKPSPLHYDSNNSTPVNGPRTPPSTSSYRRSTPQQSQHGYHTSPSSTTPMRASMLRSGSPTPVSPPPMSSGAPKGSNTTPRQQMTENDRDGSLALNKLPAAQLREMRESFQMLDRDNDGYVDIEDVKDMLGQIGEMPSASTLSSYFPQGSVSSSNAMNLSSYLNGLSSLLAPMSSPEELAAAFAALDEDDSGQIDVDALKKAVLQCDSDDDLTHSLSSRLTERDLDDVMRDFIGRRAFGKGMMNGNVAASRGDVFRWKDFVGSLSGTEKNIRKESHADAVVAA